MSEPTVMANGALAYDEDEQAPPYEDVAADTAERIRQIRAADASNTLADGMFWDQQGPGFSCGEAEALAALMYHAGVPLDEVVDYVVTGHGGPHSNSEDAGDDHWHTPRPYPEEGTDGPSTD